MLVKERLACATLVHKANESPHGKTSRTYKGDVGRCLRTYRSLYSTSNSTGACHANQYCRGSVSCPSRFMFTRLMRRRFLTPVPYRVILKVAHSGTLFHNSSL